MKKYFIATIVSVLYIPIITILSELHKPTNELLKSTFWHHWLGKSVVTIFLFLLTVLLLSKSSDKKNSDGTYLTWITVLALLASLAIFGFYVIEYIPHLS